MRKTVLAAAILTVLSGAQAHEMVKTEVAVPHADLDLANPHDLEILHRRIVNAAAEACGGDPLQASTYSVVATNSRDEFRRCREDAVARAEKQIAHQPTAAPSLR